jgi:hypothetical protein
MTRVAGIGCFQFKPSGDSEFDDFDLEKFKSDVTRCLEVVENITQIETGSVEDSYIGFRSFEPDDEDDVWPIPLPFCIRFSLFISKKVQKTIGFLVDSENFFVVIKYEYEKPIVYVIYDTKEDVLLTQPSNAVALVREYLKDRIGTKVDFGTIGPSPFHANFVFEECKSGKIEIYDMSEGQSGYARYLVKYDQSFDDFPLETFIWRYGEVFSRYYYLTVQNLKLRNSRSNIISESWNLLNKKEVGFFKKVKSIFSDRESIDRLQMELIEERLVRAETRSFILEHDNSDGLTLDLPVRSHFESFLKDIEPGSWSDFGDVAKFLEDRRQNVIRNLSTLSSGVVGGIIGALIGATATAMLTGEGSSPPPVVQNDISETKKVEKLEQRPQPSTTGAPSQ